MKVSIGEISLADMDVEMKLEYRLGRRIEEGSDGDDIILEGRKSSEFTISGKMGMEQLQALEKEISRGQPIFRSEFGEYKVAVKSLYYRSASGEFVLELVEDIG